MPHTETFFVSTKTNKVKPLNANSASYFNPDLKSENYGKAKYCIEVFSFNNHEKIAEQVRNIIDEKGLSYKLFRIKVETR